MLFFCLRGFSVAPHPTLLTAKYKDQLLPVVKVTRSDPVVVVKGREKRIRYRTVLVPQRVESYGEGYVRFGKLYADTIQGAIFTAEVQQQGSIHFVGVLKSTTTIKRGYIMVGVSNILKAPSEKTLINSEFLIRELPDLPAGKETTFEFKNTLQSASRHMDHFVQIFDSNGHEILTNEVEKAWRYYALLEKVQHQGVLKQYFEMYAGKDHQAFPVVRPKPVFPVGTIVPADASAIMTISPQGYVADLIINGLPDPLHKAAIQALEGWLFMPQLEAGKPVASRVQVPILF